MADQGKLIRIIAAALVVLSAASLVMLVVVYRALPSGPDEKTVADARKLAGELADNNLPLAAIDEYSKILDRGALDDKEKGAVCYLIGKTYFEDVGDYEKAAAYYVRARSLDGSAAYYNEAGKNLISCLERLGRRLDARRELDRQTNIMPDTTRPPGKIVATVGSKDITLAEYREAVATLPQEAQDKLTNPAERRKFLDQLIGQELVYGAAVREGFDRDATVLRDMKNLEKEYLTQYYIREKVVPTIQPDTTDLEMYFKANKDKYGGKELGEVRQQVMQDFVMYKGQKAISDYINRLSQAEKIQVFEENLK